MSSSTTPLSFDAPPCGTPANIRIYQQESLTYIMPHIVCDYLHSNFSGGLRKTHLFCKSARDISRSRSSNVMNFGTKRKRVCDFLLVRHSNLLQVFCTPHYSTLIFGVFLLDQIADVVVSPRIYTLSYQPWSYFWSIPTLATYVITVPERHRRTDDKRTDWRTYDIGYCGITAICVASRGKNDAALSANFRQYRSCNLC